MVIRDYTETDLDPMLAIWNEIVEEGNAFPQENYLDLDNGRKFYSSQS